MSKLFSVVGVSRLRAQDPFKLRVANGSASGRAKRLVRCGHVDVSLFEVEAMSKEKALAWLQAEHPALAAQLKSKSSKAVKVAAKEAEVEVVVVDVAISPAAKLALKRMKDAARKREKRAAEKAAKLAAVA